MERGLYGMDWMASKPNPHDRLETAREDWGGTGLCSQAQADGVPCTALGRECDACERAARESRRPAARAS